MNKAILVGRLTKDVEVRTTSNNIACAQFTVAVQRKYKDEQGNYASDFINCVAWRQTASFISQHFTKGMKIGLTGSIQTRSYNDKNGNTVYVTEVLVEDAEFIESKKTEAAKAPTKPTAPSVDEVSADDLEELPFEI